MITSVLPWPLRRNGGAQRTELLRRALERYGIVDIFAVGENDLFEQKIDLNKIPSSSSGNGVLDYAITCERTSSQMHWYLGPFAKIHDTLCAYRQRYHSDTNASEKFDRFVEKNGPYNLIVSRYLSPAMKVGLSRYTGTPKVLDFDDIDWSTFKSLMEFSPWKGPRGRLAQYLVYKDIKKTCLRALDIFDGVWVTCEEDSNEVDKDTQILPNIFFHDALPGKRSLCCGAESKKILFVGDLQFPPNRDGLDRFLSQVWPLILSRVGDAEFLIVGRGLDEEKKIEWAGNRGVRVIGFADQLGKLYEDCAFTVVPVYFGGGTKIKVLESLAHERTVVLSLEAAKGYGSLLNQVQTVVCAKSDSEFANACVKLLEVPDLRGQMAARGKAIVSRQFSFEAFSDAVDVVIRPMITSAKED